MTCVGQQDTMSQLGESPWTTAQHNTDSGQDGTVNKIGCASDQFSRRMHRILTAAAHLVLHCMLRHLHVAMSNITTESG